MLEANETRKLDLYKKNSGVIIMGILNVTPDSFSDGGSVTNTDEAVEKALRLIEEGAEIIDIGGESTRPGFERVSEEEELRRVIDVVRILREKSNVIISVDTTKPVVAEEALKVGADIINDISCLESDEMAKVVAKYGCYYCLMHNRNTEYKDFYADYINDLESAIARLEKAGVKKDRIILDPGVGFAKDYSQNLLVTKKLKDLTKYDMPVLLGVSRKSIVGNCLGLPVDQRVEGTLALGAYGILNGADILRVHDVKEHVRMAKMLAAVENQEG